MLKTIQISSILLSFILIGTGCGSSVEEKKSDKKGADVANIEAQEADAARGGEQLEEVKKEKANNTETADTSATVAAKETEEVKKTQPAGDAELAESNVPVENEEGSQTELIEEEVEGDLVADLSEEQLFLLTDTSKNILTTLPTVGKFVKELDLDEILATAVKAAEGDGQSIQELSREIIEAVIQGVKMIPEATQIMETLEPIIMDSTDLLIFSINKAISGDIVADDIKHIANTAIGILSMIPNIGQYIQKLNLEEIVNSAVDLSYGDKPSAGLLAKNIINTIWIALNEFPGLSEKLDKIEPFVKGSTDLLVLFINGMMQG